MKKGKMKVAAVQFSMSEDMGANMRKAARLARTAAKKGAQIICLPELYNVPYFPQYRGKSKDKYSESVPGPSTEIFSKIAKEFGAVIIVPLYEKENKGKGRTEYHNTAAVIGENGRITGKYRKIHIPEDPGFYEKDYFKESDGGYEIFKTKFGTFAVLICYDQWFPEAARLVRLSGAEIIFYPTALGNIIGYNAEGDWHDAWETVQRGHAIANNLYAVAVNRVGREGNMRFFGQSFVCDPFGKVLKRAGADKEEILVADIDLLRNKFYSEGWGFLRNRRPDTYGPLASGKLAEKSKKLKKVGHYKDMQKALTKSPGRRKSR
jgi:agmatine deiminase